MKDTNQAISVVWKELNKAKASLNITGDIYKVTRALNSRKEDIVINALPMAGDSLQRCFINVNVYVNNLVIEVNGQNDPSLPDTARLQVLTSAIISLLEDVSADDHYYFVSGQQTIREEQLNQHYSNIKLEFYFINN